MLWESYGTHASCYTYHVFLELERYLVVNRRSVDQYMSMKLPVSAWQGNWRRSTAYSRGVIGWLWRLVKKARARVTL